MDDKEFQELLDIQKRMQKTISQEQEMDETLDILSIINEMAPHPDQRVQIEEVIIEATTRGFSSEDTEKIIRKLINERILFEPTEGFIQRR